jgi:hypothetical protein
MCAVVRLRALMARQAARLTTNPPIVQPLFLNPQSSVNFKNFAQGCIALSYFWWSDQLLLQSDIFMSLN